MSQIRWTHQAASDLEAIFNYISRDSPSYARGMVRRLVTAVDQLVEFPESGRVVPEMNDRQIRELIRDSYRIVYRVREGVVEILTVHRSSRPLPQDVS